nr:ribonuclease H-like domain-containing protein [Tanacetum cinerariifolium]
MADGTLSRYKARLVVNGSTRLEGVDETFSPVVKAGTIRTVLSLAASRHWPIHQLDVKNAFLHCDLSETIYMHQPPGFRDYVHPDYVCLLQRRCNSSLSIYRKGIDTSYLLLYVDDIVLTASSESLLQQIIRSLHQEARMATCNPSRTPIDTESKLKSDGDSVSDPTVYRSLAGVVYFCQKSLTASDDLLSQTRSDQSCVFSLSQTGADVKALTPVRDGGFVLMLLILTKPFNSYESSTHPNSPRSKHSMFF